MHAPTSAQLTDTETASASFGGKTSSALALVSALQRERRRIAQQLHDTTCQSMSGIQMLAKVLARRLQGDAPRLRESAEDLVRMVQEAASELQRVARSLQEPRMENGGLLTALAHLAEAPEADAIPCQVLPCPDDFPWPGRLQAAELFYVAQEAVENARKHSGASRISLALDALPHGGIRLTVEDNGCGFAVCEALASGAPGLALQQARADALNATLNFESVRGSGTRVVCQLPPAHPCPPLP